jgi:hypothetical protein
MDTVIPRLQALQRAIAGADYPTLLDQEIDRLYFAEVQGLLHVEFYGQVWDEPGEPFALLLDLLCDVEVAASLRALSFRGPDEGANGTRNWDFTRLLATDTTFPNLTSLYVEPTQPEHHNHSIIAEVYEEEGMIGRLLDRMPALQSLTVPSAPDASFFTRGVRPLNRLRVESGYDHQDFIRNLSRSTCFPELVVLDFGDYSQRYMDDYPERCTPFGDYVELLRSPAGRSIRLLILRNTAFTPDQFTSLCALGSVGTLRAIQCHGDYFAPPLPWSSQA